MAVAERVRYIASRDNPAYREIKALAQDKRARRDARRTVLDGAHLMETARDAAATFRVILAVPALERAGVLQDWLRQCPGTQGLVLPEILFKSLSPTQHPSGLMAVVDVPGARGRVIELAVLLEDIQDPGNLGAVLRCAAAAGAQAAYLSEGCAEAWSPKALRGGQGAQFLLDIHEQADLPAIAGAFPGRRLAAVLDAAASLYSLDLSGPCAFAFGNEGAGLSASLRSACEGFTIPMPGRVESLNVAAAASVSLFERVRQLRGR